MRIKLHKNEPTGDYEVYPIYDIDYTGIYALSGASTEYDLQDGGYYYHQWIVNNNAIWTDNKIPANIPRTETGTGNIIPFWHNYPRYENGVYKLPIETRESFDIIPIGQRPADWGTNPNYCTIETVTIAGNYQAEIPMQRTVNDTWDARTQYYLDTKRVQTRLFYLDNTISFAVEKGNYYNYNRYSSQRYMTASILRYSDATAPYAYTKPNAQIWNKYYYINVDSGDDYFRDSFTVGKNIIQIFVHYTHNQREYYGIATLEMNNFTENATPISIKVSAWESAFWVSNIISGGESGAGEWGNPTIPTVNDGTFSSTSNSVGTDNPNYSTTAIQTRVNTALSGLFSGLTGVYSIYLLDTADGQSISFTELTRIYNVLYASGNDKFLTRYLQSMYNPLSAVIAMHLIPYQFTVSALFGVTVRKQLTISGYNVSTAISETTPPEYNILKPLGRVVFPRLDMPKYFGGFADFAPYTQCILHLPFIGAVELKTNAIAHGAITVEYLCDMISGNVTARISCTDNTGENTQYVHTASGNCAYNLPLFTMNQNGDAVGKLLSGGAGIVSGALTGNPVNVATGVAGVVGAAIESSFSPRSTQISGNMGGNNMLMSNLDIWLEIVRPVWVENMYYQKLNGIPANMSNCIADCGQDASAGVAYDGFLQIETIDLDNVPCTEQEKQEIETLLKQGVFIRGSEI